MSVNNCSSYMLLTLLVLFYALDSDKYWSSRLMELCNEQGKPLDQENNESASDQKGNSKRWWQTDVSDIPDGLNWGELAGEFKNLFKFSKENRSWWMIVKTSLIIFATSLAPSFFDMGSDALSTYN